MKIEALLDGIEILESKGNLDIDISSLNYNSRKIEKDGLFAAIKGLKTDGHKYIDSAIENGAKAVVLEVMPEDIKDGVTYIKVADSRNAMAKMSAEFYGNPSRELNLIGITGTNGKTTTSYIMRAVYEAAGHKVGIIGTIGNIIDGELIETGTTTPDSLELQQSFRLMLDKGIDTVIMEVSSHALDLDRVAYSEFDTGIYTNLSVDHLDYHKDLDDYLEAKKKLFNLTVKKNLVNADDEYGKKILSEEKMQTEKTSTYGIEESDDINASNIKLDSQGVHFRLNTPKGSIDMSCSIPGIFTVYNSLAAASAAYFDGISLETIKKGIESIEDVKGRFEVVPTDTDFTVIIDFAHTPDALEKVLKCIREFAEKRIIAVFGAGGDRDNSKRAVMGEISGKYADLSVVTSDNPRTEDPDSIIAQIVEGVEKSGGEYVTVTDRKDAINYAVNNAEEGDIVLLAGKGHENYVIIGETKYHFDEREVVQEAVSNMKK